MRRAGPPRKRTVVGSFDTRSRALVVEGAPELAKPNDSTLVDAAHG